MPNAFVPTFAVYSDEASRKAIRTGFVTMQDAIAYATSRRTSFVIRRSRYIAGYPGTVEGNFPFGMIVHSQR